MINLRLEIEGEEQLRQALDELAKDVQDFRPVWEELEQIFYDIETKQFRSEGAHSGAPWKDLSSDYGKWKELKYPGKPILERTGALRRSLTGRGPGGIREITKTSMTLGSNLPYADIHQRGGRRLPARPAINLSPADRRRLVRKALKELAELAEEARIQTAL
jgi:phage gpG-like protein